MGEKYKKYKAFEDHERVHIVQAPIGNYYGNVAVWKDKGTKTRKPRYWMGVENYSGWSGKQISEEFYNDFRREFQNT